VLAHAVRQFTLGLARTGSRGSAGSGDFAPAFSTQLPQREGDGQARRARLLTEPALDQLLRAASEAGEEAIVNAPVAAETITGINGARVHALPHAVLAELMLNRSPS
jgi:D-aminopeptidase